MTTLFNQDISTPLCRDTLSKARMNKAGLFQGFRYLGTCSLIAPAPAIGGNPRPVTEACIADADNCFRWTQYNAADVGAETLKHSGSMPRE